MLGTKFKTNVFIIAFLRLLRKEKHSLGPTKDSGLLKHDGHILAVEIKVKAVQKQKLMKSHH